MVVSNRPLLVPAVPLALANMEVNAFHPILPLASVTQTPHITLDFTVKLPNALVWDPRNVTLELASKLTFAIALLQDGQELTAAFPFVTKRV